MGCARDLLSVPTVKTMIAVSCINRASKISVYMHGDIWQLVHPVIQRERRAIANYRAIPSIVTIEVMSH